MTNKKRFLHPALLAALMSTAPVFGLQAQDGGDRPRPPHEPPPSPLFDALDTNHDGTISADEIANASTALKALLKDGATQITREDVRPPRPPAPRERPDRDDAAPPRPHSGPESFRPHHGSPRDDADADDAAPPRRHGDEDHADRPTHRPPPRRGPEDGPAADEHARPRPSDADGADRPPRPADEAGEGMNGEHRHPADDRAMERPAHRPPPPSPLFDALDTNHDGVISAVEITHTPDALKALDKTGSGQIKRADLRMMPPPRDHD